MCGKPENKQNKQTIMGRRDKKGGSVQDDAEKYRRYTNPFIYLFFFILLNSRSQTQQEENYKDKKTEAEDETITSSLQHGTHPQQQPDCYSI